MSIKEYIRSLDYDQLIFARDEIKDRIDDIVSAGQDSIYIVSCGGLNCYAATSESEAGFWKLAVAHLLLEQEDFDLIEELRVDRVKVWKYEAQEYLREFRKTPEECIWIKKGQ